MGYSVSDYGIIFFMRSIRFFLISFTIHAFVIALVLWHQTSKPEVLRDFQKVEAVEIDTFYFEKTSRMQIATKQKNRKNQLFDKSNNLKNLKPNFLKKENFFSNHLISEKENGTVDTDLNERFKKQLLVGDLKTSKAFDLLASKIGASLEYPRILSENGIQGIAVLELVFDSKGKVDETQSKFFGGTRIIRGLFVKAARTGIISWYESDAVRVRPERFRNQHFRAVFEVSSYFADKSQTKKISSGSYEFVRRRYAPTCIEPAPSGAVGLNVACLALRVGGFIKNQISTEYKTKLFAIKENLEHFDNLGLSGINAKIEKI